MGSEISKSPGETTGGRRERKGERHGGRGRLGREM